MTIRQDPLHVTIVNTDENNPQNNTSNGVQNPLPTDGDSVYVKDIWVDESIVTNWIDTDNNGGDIISIPFNDLHTAINNNSTDNPKILRVHFNRTVSLNQVGIGCAVHPGKNFSNVKIVALGSGEVERTVLDNSTDSTKYTSKNYEFGPELCNAIKIEFHTADEITLSNITIHKVVQVAARLKALKPDGTVTDIDATAGGNLKVSLEEVEPGANVPFLQLVSQGDVTGHSIVNKFGQNNALNTASYEDVWDGGAIYPYPADDTAPIVNVRSTSASDTFDLEVQGLDITGALVVQTITLTGTTPAVLVTPLWRIFRMKNVGSADNVGDISAQDVTSSIIYAIIQIGNNQTLMALYTIPLGKTGYLYQGTNNLSDVSRGVSASGRLTMRPYGGVFQLKKTFGVSSDGSGFISISSPLPGKIPERTDIRVSAISSASGVSLNTTFDILLIDN